MLVEVVESLSDTQNSTGNGVTQPALAKPTWYRWVVLHNFERYLQTSVILLIHFQFPSKCSCLCLVSFMSRLNLVLDGTIIVIRYKLCNPYLSGKLPGKSVLQRKSLVSMNY